jgi:hypothetical protein
MRFIEIEWMRSNAGAPSRQESIPPRFSLRQGAHPDERRGRVVAEIEPVEAVSENV